MGVFTGLIYAIVLAYPLMKAWNYVLPNLLGLPELVFWSAFALIYIINLLGTALK